MINIYSHCRVVKQEQCFPPRLKLIDFYTELDVSLGHYLHRLFRREPCPNGRCKEPLSAHSLTYSHHHKTVSIKLKELKTNYILSGNNNADHNEQEKHSGVPIHKRDGKDNEAIVMWTRCKICKWQSRLSPMQDRTFFMSFGKVLEMMMYSVPATPLHSPCSHNVFEDHVLCFGWNDVMTESGDMGLFKVYVHIVW